MGLSFELYIITQEKFRNERILCAKKIEKISMLPANNPHLNRKTRDESVFEKRVNTKFNEFALWGNARALCDNIFCKIQTVWDFATKFTIKQNWKNCCAIQTYILQHEFWEKKIVEDLERHKLVELTHCDGAAPSLLVPKKTEHIT